MRHRLLITLLFCFSFFLLHSQERRRIIFNHLGQEALSQSTLYGMEKDNLGFTWLATDDGLCKYDGSTFRFIKHNPNDTSSIELDFVRGIVKDKTGLLWFIIDGAGLYSIDPLTEKLQYYPNATGNNASHRTRALAYDGNEMLYLGSFGGGFMSFNIRTHEFTTWLHNDKDPNSLANNSVFSLAMGIDGQVWIGFGYDGGLDEFDPRTKRLTHHDFFGTHTNEHYVTRIYPRPENYILITSTEGIWRYHPKTRTVDRILNNPKDTNSLGSNVMDMLAFYPGGKVLVFHDHGVDETDTAFHHFRHNRNSPADPYSTSASAARNFLYFDEIGALWIGSERKGLDVIYPQAIDADAWRTDNEGRLLENVFTLQEDPYGKLWIGTYGHGAFSFDAEKETFRHYEANKADTTMLSDGLVYSFSWIDSTYLWLLTENGMDKLNRSTGKVERQLFTTRDENSGDKKYERIHRTCEMFVDGNGDYWIVIIQGGLLHYEPKTGKMTRWRFNPKDSTGLSDSRIFSMAFDRKDSMLWMGTFNGGVNAYDMRTGKIHRFRHNKKDPYSLTNDWAYTVVIDTTTNILWVGTDGGGLDAVLLDSLPKDRSKAHFYHFTEADGLPENLAVALLPDGKGNIWIGGNSYLTRFTPPVWLKGTADTTLFPRGVFKTFTTADGLPFDGVSEYGLMFSKRDGRLYVGGDGFYSFHPDSIHENRRKPPVYITGLYIFDKPFATDTSILLKKSLTLAYDQNFIRFDFAVLNFMLPASNKVAWKLEGLDENWTISSSQRTASYTNLSPGTYVFRVRGANNNGYWNDEGARITIVILPPFWKTKWFYALVFLVVVSAIVLYVRWRERKLKRDKRKLESTVNERTAELKVAYQQIEEKNKDITDSINYARRIQEAMLPSGNEFSALLPQSFVLYRPKDIVSGDFYWITRRNDWVIFAAVDCTGHGVPGAFMSLIGNKLLDEIVNSNGIISPERILDEMRSGVIRALKQRGVEGENKDGMDIALCAYHPQTQTLRFSGAHNPLWLVRHANATPAFEEIRGDKQPVGISYQEEKPFGCTEVQLRPGDCLYIFTDGYADQFGGEKGKKFKYKALQELIVRNSALPMAQQGKLLEETLLNWKMGHEQNDDILVIGVCVS